MDDKFLEMLACPVCRGVLRWDPARLELLCEACGKAYPVREGIPDLLPESGRTLDAED
jgi:uncharacterized protein YbaR (Trm112 family)